MIVLVLLVVGFGPWAAAHVDEAGCSARARLMRPDCLAPRSADGVHGPVGSDQHGPRAFRFGVDMATPVLPVSLEKRDPPWMDGPLP